VRKILKLVDEHYASGGLKARIYYDVGTNVVCPCDQEPHSSLAAHHFTRRGDIAVTSELRDDAVWKHPEDFGLTDVFFQKHSKNVGLRAMSDDGEEEEDNESSRDDIAAPRSATPPAAAVAATPPAISPRAPAPPGRGMSGALVQTSLRMTRLEARAATLVGMLLENGIEVPEELLSTANI
jgi:hypothetical protein